MSDIWFDTFEAYEATAVNYENCNIYKRIIPALDFDDAVSLAKMYFEKKFKETFVVGVIKVGDMIFDDGLKFHLNSGHHERLIKDVS